MIRLDGIEVRFGDFTALKDINIHVKEGEFYTFLGPSGCGKTTTLRTITGFIEPVKGTVTVKGKDLTHVPVEKRNIGMVFQNYALFPSMSVYENIAFAMQVIEAPRRMMQRNVNNVLDIVGLRDKYKCFPNQLSGGEQQRVAIARAIVNNPAIVIADEPTGNLDPETSWGIMDIFKSINASGTTIVMATHDKTIVDAMQKRVIAIENGEIVRDEARGGYGYEN